MENSRTRPHLHITHIPYLVEIFRHLLVCVSSWIRILVCVMLCGQQPNRTVVDLTHLASRWTGSFSSLFADNRPESEWKQSKETEPSTTNSKETTKIPRPKRKRARVAERETIWLAAHLTRKSVAFGSHPLYHPNKKKCKSNANFNVNFFILSQYLFIFLFVFPSLCVRFLSFFFAPFIFPPLATPTATPPPDWLLRPRPPRVAESLGIEADMRTLALYLGKWRARGKKKYFKKMNGLMNLSIPKPNWKWIETKSNESFVKTKKKIC